MKIKIEFEVSESFLQDVLSLAIPGSNYWAQYSSPKKSSIKVHNHGDEEEEQSPAKIINMADIAEGIRRLVQRDFNDENSYAHPDTSHSENIVKAIADGDVCNLDQWDGDIILQLAFFGHIVYG